jgi:hypothetical protein
VVTVKGPVLRGIVPLAALDFGAVLDFAAALAVFTGALLEVAVGCFVSFCPLARKGIVA